MTGKNVDGASSPSSFNECVSQEQLQKAIAEAQSGLSEMIDKSCTDAVNKLHLGEALERLDRRLSELTDKVTALETAPKTGPKTNDATSDVEDFLDEDTVFSPDGNVDRRATKEKKE